MGQPETRLQQLREERGLSQVELARRAGMTRGHISNLESGEREFTLAALRKLAKALECTVMDLLPAEDAPNAPTERDLVVLRAFDHLDEADRALASQIAVDLVRMVRNVAAKGTLGGRQDAVDRLATIWNGMNEERREWALNVLSGSR